MQFVNTNSANPGMFYVTQRSKMPKIPDHIFTQNLNPQFKNGINHPRYYLFSTTALFRVMEEDEVYGKFMGIMCNFLQAHGYKYLMIQK